MEYTISDFYRVFEDKLLLVAGENGLSRPVNSVGILDYELDPTVKDRYIGGNFHPEMLVVTTFMYAKKNPFLIGDAVRYLVDKGCSGLLIRNVFKLPIPETVIRYADSKNFPILLVKSGGIYFEDFVYEVMRHRELLQNIDFCEDALNALLSEELSDEEVARRARSIIPSIGASYFVVYADASGTLTVDTYQEILQRYHRSGLLSVSNKLLKYGNHILFIFSSDSVTQSYEKETFAQIAQLFCVQERLSFKLGVSAAHYYLFEFKEAILEGKYAAGYHELQRGDYALYDQIGVYQLLLPYCHTEDFTKFSNQILFPLRDYDAESGGALFETLLTYVQSHESIKKTAEAMGQHENTIRYRLEKISAISAQSYRDPAGMEQLSLAMRIHIAQGLLPEQG